MTRQQAIFIVGLNAMISLVISLLVVWLVGPRAGPSAPLPHAIPSAMPTTEAASRAGLPARPGPSMTPPLVVHKVKMGETLSWIALKYDVSPGAIMEANNLADPDVLALDQELIIPVPETEPTVERETVVEKEAPVRTEVPVETATASPSPTKTSPSPTPTTTPTGEFRLEITQIVARGRQEAEVLVLTNYGRDVRLQGWTLSNDRGKVYSFPNLTLFSGNSVRVYTTKGRNTPSDLYWGLESAAWGAEVEIATLKDADGKVQATKDLG